MTKRTIRSEALDALIAKEKHAEKRLAATFVAFVQPDPKVADAAVRKEKAAYKRAMKEKPRSKRQEPRRLLGYVVYGAPDTREYLLTPNFVAYVVGNPPSQAHEIKTAIREFWEKVEERLDHRDAHAARIISGLKAYHQFVLEDKDEARAIGAEVLFVDFLGVIRTCTYDGAEDSEPISKQTKKLVISGCYDKKIQTAVRRILRRYVQGKTLPSKEDLRNMAAELKKATKLKRVGYNPFTRDIEE